MQPGYLRREKLRQMIVNSKKGNPLPRVCVPLKSDELSEFMSGWGDILNLLRNGTKRAGSDRYRPLKKGEGGLKMSN